DSPYDVVERPIALRADNHAYRELEVETKPQQSWTAVYGDERGLAIISEGLMESAVRDLPERPIALTLLRATRRTVMTDGEPEGQLLGEHRFRYWIVPLAAAPDRVRLTLTGQQLAAGLRDVALRAADVAGQDVGGSLPPEAGFLEISGGALLTSARRVEGALEVRVYNPSDERAKALLRLGDSASGDAAPTSYVPVDLESRPLGEAQPIRGGAVPVTLGSKKIVTLRLA
ncbi:MAG: glycoside hydrolase family 38, partial [Chloroflexi bacterium]|nr:glycoside hydrolase family 38 [Chloroflexota bacterium]